MGVTFSNIAVNSLRKQLNYISHLQVNLIIAQMSSTKVPVLNVLLLTYITMVVLVLSGMLASMEIYTLRIAAILFTFAHLHYGICVVVLQYIIIYFM
jgi:hypothetical protein